MTHSDFIVDTGAAIDTTNPMHKIVENTAERMKLGDTVDGTVIAADKRNVFVDLGSAVGIIYGREFMNARDLIKHMGKGDPISAKVVDLENENGYIELSLKEARQSLIWADAEDIVREKTQLELVVKDANKGGLIIEWQGISGFLPASQLSQAHYPNVGDDKDSIVAELKKLVGERIVVSMIAANPKEGKLIFSEKEQGGTREKSANISKYNVGDIAEGEITGIVDFGAFMKIEDGLEGLVHISEMDWGLVEDPRKFFKVGQKIKAQIIEIKDGKISLSVKALKENPWRAAENKWKRGDTVRGAVIKFNKYGALVSIEEGVAGLVHVSEFGTEDKLKQTLELGKVYNFTISLFEPKEQRMTLSYKA